MFFYAALSLCLPEFFFFGPHTCIPGTSNPVYLRGGEDIIDTFLLVKFFFYSHCILLWQSLVMLILIQIWFTSGV